uniref:Transmembrane protein n=1 Tax=Cacopsylla melanoneura TaxID=428564 RepID=A0A8D8Z260_9HEMI
MIDTMEERKKERLSHTPSISSSISSLSFPLLLSHVLPYASFVLFFTSLLLFFTRYTARYPRPSEGRQGVCQRLLSPLLLPYSQSRPGYPHLLSPLDFFFCFHPPFFLLHDYSFLS